MPHSEILFNTFQKYLFEKDIDCDAQKPQSIKERLIFLKLQMEVGSRKTSLFSHFLGFYFTIIFAALV